MQHLSTAFLIISLVIVVNHGSGVSAQDDNDHLLGIESKNRAITIINSPQYVNQQANNQSSVKLSPPPVRLEQRPPSKPPNIPELLSAIPQGEAFSHYGHHQIPPSGVYSKQPIKIHPSQNSVYKFPRVVPLPHHRTYYYKPSRPLVYAASTGKPSIAKSPKFSLPVQVINGISADFVRPPKKTNNTSTSSTTSTTTEATTTTTQKILRNKRIWPKHVLNKANTTVLNNTLTKVNSTKLVTNSTYDADRDALESRHRVRFAYRDAPNASTTVHPLTTRGYRPVTRRVKAKSTTTTPAPINFTHAEPNEWVPMVPSHFTKPKRAPLTPIQKRSDVFNEFPDARSSKQKMYLQSFGLVPMTHPMPNLQINPTTTEPAPVMARKRMVYVKSKQNLNPIFSGYSGKRGRPTVYHTRDLESGASHSHPGAFKIKHHHHHHHHRYVKTVEKPVKVPVKVEVPKPYPVTVEKKVEVPVEKIRIVEKPVPYAVTVEKKVPYPIGIKIPHPVPVKVVEKEYVPKPYPVVQHVPVVKQVQVPYPQAVPVPVEKQVPYPVQVKVPVPVDRPVPVAVPYEKRVPYPVPVRILVPQPYPVEKRVPYPVEVKVREPVEVVRHVPIKVPYPQPYAVKIPHPVPVQVEKRIPYPVEKKVHVPVEVRVPQRIEVEKKVPIYIPKPYPVEKKVPYAVKVPYPIKVPVKVPYAIKVPVKVPIYIHPGVQYYGDEDNQYGTDNPGSSTADYSATIHGNSGFTGFESRSDKTETTTTPIPS